LKKLITIEKNLFKFCCFLFTFFVLIPTVSAAKVPLMTCKYGTEDQKTIYELKIYKDFSHSGKVTMYEGKTKNNKEKIENWTNDEGNTRAFIRNSGICPAYVSFKKSGGYHINFGEVKGAKKLLLINDSTTNVLNLRNYLQIEPSTMCPFYDENNNKLTISIPNIVWESLNDIAGGQANFKVGDCNSDGLEKVVVLTDVTNKSNQAYTPGIQTPNSCINYPYIGYPYVNDISKVNTCKELTRSPKNEDGTVDEPEPGSNRAVVSKQYRSEHSAIGKEFTYEIAYEPNSQWFAGNYISFLRDKDYDNNKVYIIHYGTYDDYKEKVLNPMISQLKWPDKIYCEKVFGYTTYSSNCNVISPSKTDFKCSDIENTALVCAVDNRVFGTGYVKQNYTFNLVTDDNSNLENIKNGNYYNVQTGEPINCSDFVTDGGVNIIQDIFNIIMIVGPILAIVLGGFDFAKASLQSDEQALKKAGSNFTKRIIAAVLLFLLPLLITFILEIAVEAGVLTDLPDLCV